MGQKLVVMNSVAQFISFLEALIEMLCFALKGSEGQELLLYGLLSKSRGGEAEKTFVKGILFYLASQKNEPDSWQSVWIDNLLVDAIKKGYIDEFTKEVTRDFLRDNARVVLNALRIQDSVEEWHKSVKLEEEGRASFQNALGEDYESVVRRQPAATSTPSQTIYSRGGTQVEDDADVAAIMRDEGITLLAGSRRPNDGEGGSTATAKKGRK